MHVLDRLENSNTLKELFRWLFAKNISHIILTNHLVYWGMLHITGEINFQWLQWLGSLNICFLFFVLYTGLYKSFSDRRLLLTLLMLILFQIQWWNGALWAIASLSSFFVISFSMLAFLCMQKTSPPFTAISVMAALLASWSQANGLLVWPLLALTWHQQQRGTKHMLILVSLAILACTPYALIPNNHENTSSSAGAMQFILGSIMLPASLPTLVGAAFSLDHRHILPAFAGGILLLFMIWRYFRQGIIKAHDFSGACILFLLGSCLMIATARCGWSHLDVMLQSRYKPYSILILLFISYHYLLGKQHNNVIPRKIALLSLFAAVAFNLCSWAFNLPHVKIQQTLYEQSGETWLAIPGAGSLGFTALLIDDPEQYLKPLIAREQYRPLRLLKARNHPLSIDPITCPTTIHASNAHLQVFEHELVGTRTLEVLLQDFTPYESQAPSLLLCATAGHGYRIRLESVHWPAIADTARRRAKVFIKPLPDGMRSLPPGGYELLIENPRAVHEAWSGPQPVWVTIPED